MASARRDAGLKKTQQWQRFVLAVLQKLERRAQTLPRHKAQKEGERLGRVAFNLIRTVNKRPYEYALRNLRLTNFPHAQASRDEQNAFIRQVCIHFAKSLMDFLRGPILTKADVDQIVQPEGWQHALDAHRAGKGVIFVTAHLGNWEMLARWIVSEGIPLTVVARDTEDDSLGQWITRVRQSGGYRVMYRGASARELLSLLKKNEGIGILPDQNSGDVFAPFLGVPAGTAVGPAALALHTGAALIPCYGVRQPDDTYRLIFQPPLDTHATGNKQADQARITSEVNLALERVIRQYPEQWLWLHNRWKSAFEKGNQARAFPNGKDEALWQRWQREG